MNKDRRDRIKDTIIILSNCKNDIERIKDDEDDARSNMPENLETSEKYEQSEEASDALDDAMSDIQGAIDTLENI